jgi:hypothetical protein
MSLKSKVGRGNRICRSISSAELNSNPIVLSSHSEVKSLLATQEITNIEQNKRLHYRVDKDL